MYVYTHISICLFIYIHICVFIYICIYVYVYVCVVCVSLSLSLPRLSLSLYIYIYIYVIMLCYSVIHYTMYYIYIYVFRPSSKRSWTRRASPAFREFKDTILNFVRPILLLTLSLLTLLDPDFPGNSLGNPYGPATTTPLN